MAAVNIYVSSGDGGRLKIPVPPERIEIQKPGNNSVANVIELGQINQLRIPDLSPFGWSSFFPSGESHFETDHDIQECIDFFNNAMDNLETVEVSITEIGFNMTASVESFSYIYDGGDTDCNYTVQFKEYRSYGAITAQIASEQPTTPNPSGSQEARENPTKQLAVGVTVTVNGRLHQDSYGTGPGATENNATRKVHLIVDKSRPYPIHVTTLEGGWRGWVKESDCKVV